MSTMTEVYRSGVNIWDCDQMGHMNVRFYVARFVDGLFGFAQVLGFGPRYMRQRDITLVVRDQHIRFHREMRPGTPYFIRAGIVSAQSETIRVFEEIINVASGEVAATSVSDVALANTGSRDLLSFTEQQLAGLADHRVELPDYARARGTSTAAPRPAPTLQEAEALNLIPIFRGVVLSADVDEKGYMRPHSYMGRISDGISNFFIALRDEDRSKNDNVGGAALEYRFVYHQTPQIGDVLLIRSGLKDIVGKASNFCHWMFNAETGECLATTEAVAVSFDLITRKAIELPADARATMMEKAVPGLSL